MKPDNAKPYSAVGNLDGNSTEKHKEGVMDTERGRVIQFPGTRERVSSKPPRQIQNIDGMKYYTDQQIKLLRRTVRDRSALDIDRNQVTSI